VRTRLEVDEITMPQNVPKEISEMKVYELLDRRLEKEKAALAN